eukprot:TRINITY_DN7032_c4_g1_i2.p1 TRINITY_DN7032_c4_g1~~TRINITY_DN7032_c4_g1_i2.p1  ORF type:complete len:114 (-),score=8.77 TRINITY_DN7032_c4_g1_i2:43-384(-)
MDKCQGSVVVAVLSETEEASHVTGLLQRDYCSARHPLRCVCESFFSHRAPQFFPQPRQYGRSNTGCALSRRCRAITPRLTLEHVAALRARVEAHPWTWSGAAVGSWYDETACG